MNVTKRITLFALKVYKGTDRPSYPDILREETYLSKTNEPATIFISQEQIKSTACTIKTILSPGLYEIKIKSERLNKKSLAR